MTLDGTVLKESADLVILGVTFDAKLTFQKHFRSVSSAAAQRLGIMRNSWQVFRDRSLLLRSFWSFVLPVLEYFSAVWCSTADSQLKLLDRVVRSAGFLPLGVSDCNLAHRRSVVELCMLFKIKSNPNASFERCIAFAVCAGASFVVHWLRIGTRSRLCSLLRAEPMLFCWHDLFFLFCLLLFYLFLPFMGLFL